MHEILLNLLHIYYWFPYSIFIPSTMITHYFIFIHSFTHSFHYFPITPIILRQTGRHTTHSLPQHFVVLLHNSSHWYSRIPNPGRLLRLSAVLPCERGSHAGSSCTCRKTEWRNSRTVWSCFDSGIVWYANGACYCVWYRDSVSDKEEVDNDYEYMI